MFKRHFAVLLLIGTGLFAQRGDAGLFFTSRDTGTPVFLPEMRNASSFDKSNQLITTNEDYRLSFTDNQQRQLPAIDFEKYELQGNAVCMQCLATCGNHPGCHRNACQYTLHWYKVEKKGRRYLQGERIGGEDSAITVGNTGKLDIRSDSALTRLKERFPDIKGLQTDFSKNMLLIRSEFGDCHASYRHEFFLDSAKQCLVWRLFEQHGGCRGSRLNQLVYAVPQIPANYMIIYENYMLPGKRQ